MVIIIYWNREYPLLTESLVAVHGSDNQSELQVFRVHSDVRPIAMPPR